MYFGYPPESDKDIFWWEYAKLLNIRASDTHIYDYIDSFIDTILTKQIFINKLW
jgi:hypothetical protein